MGPLVPLRRRPVRQAVRHPVRRLAAAVAVVAAGLLTAIGPVGIPAARAGSGVSAAEVVFDPLGGTVLSVDGTAYRGQVVVGRSGGGLAVVNRVGFEDYVAGIAEVPPDWPAAALAAQAVAARTYALWQVLVHPAAPWDAAGGQICATDSCQVYAGLARDAEPGDAAWQAAVRGTSGTVLLYQGRVIEALYGSSDGGQTVSGGVPWLPSVADPDDALSPQHHWSWSEPLSALAPVLGVPRGAGLAAVVSRPGAVDATVQAPDGSTSTRSWTADAFHALLNSRLPAPAGLPLPLPSWRYSVSTTGTDVVVDGGGFGHGMGLSQYGALGKALRGWDGAQILAAYYGPAQPERLAPGQEPATVSVALADGVGRVAVSATGPFRVLDGAGRVLALGPGAGSWEASPAGSGVGATADSAPVAPPAGSGDPAALPGGAAGTPGGGQLGVGRGPGGTGALAPGPVRSAPVGTRAVSPAVAAPVPGAGAGPPGSHHPVPWRPLLLVGLALALVVEGWTARQWWRCSAARWEWPVPTGWPTLSSRPGNGRR